MNKPHRTNRVTNRYKEVFTRLYACDRPKRRREMCIRETEYYATSSEIIYQNGRANRHQNTNRTLKQIIHLSDRDSFQSCVDRERTLKIANGELVFFWGGGALFFTSLILFI